MVMVGAPPESQRMPAGMTVVESARTVTDWPAMGSVVEYLSAHEAKAQQRKFPDYVYLPNRLGHLLVG